MISVVILTKNSASYLERCLNALTRFPEVVVIDNGSSDKSLAIAASFTNVKIYEREFCGFGALKNTGAELATNDWVLFIDSDEIISPPLVDYILGLALQNNQVVQFYRKNYYANLLVNGCSWGNDYVTRLFNRKITRFNANQVHESIITNGLQIVKVLPQTGFIYHFPYANTTQLMTKLEHYANLYAATNYTKKTVKLWMIPLKALAAFLKNYFLKQGFRYGYEGFLISSYNTLGVIVKYLKLYELNYQRKIALALPLPQLANLAASITLINQQQLLPQQVIFLLENSQFQASVELEAVIKQQLIIPGLILKTTPNCDVTTFLNDYLLTRPELDGLLYLTTLNRLADPNLVYAARRDLLGNDCSKLIIH